MITDKRIGFLLAVLGVLMDTAATIIVRQLSGRSRPLFVFAVVLVAGAVAAFLLAIRLWLSKISHVIVWGWGGRGHLLEMKRDCHTLSVMMLAPDQNYWYTVNAANQILKVASGKAEINLVWMGPNDVAQLARRQRVQIAVPPGDPLIMLVGSADSWLLLPEPAVQLAGAGQVMRLL